MRLFEKASQGDVSSQQEHPSSRFRFGNRSPSMITESKSKLMLDQPKGTSKFLNQSSRGGAETKSNSNRAFTEKNVLQTGYKGLDGKTYKSFLEYRKNSEKRLKEMTQISERNSEFPADKNQLLKQTLSGMEVRKSRSRKPLLPDINNSSPTERYYHDLDMSKKHATPSHHLFVDQQSLDHE